MVIITSDGCTYKIDLCTLEIIAGAFERQYQAAGLNNS
jgi:hypothetical protein